MRILILGLNYLPESTSIGPYTADLAQYLHDASHEVRVVTGFPLAPQWRVWEGYRHKIFMHEVVKNVPVLRTFLYVPKQPNKTLKRILFDMSFALSSFFGGMMSGPCDIIVAVSPPLQLGLTAWLLGLFKHAQFFFHIQDLIPGAATATGMMNENSLAVRIAHGLERFIYQQAACIGVICDGFAHNLLAKGVPANKIAILPNHIDLEFMCLHERDNSFREAHGLRSQDFLVMYSGSVALKQGLETFVEAAVELNDHSEIVFILVGEGPYLLDLKKMADHFSLPNLHFLPLQRREELPQQLAAADILVITQKRTITDVVFPGKLLYYMAAARPILAAVGADSETGRFIRENHVGLVTPPEDPKSLAQSILNIRRNKYAHLGENGRRVVEERFDHRIVLPRFSKHLEELTGYAK